MGLGPGAKLAHYRLLDQLGQGGMGVVWRAKDERLARTVAIKVLPAEFSADPELRERLLREARAISQLNHPNICTLYDVGSSDGIDFLVMEYLEGESLAHRLEGGPIAVDRALRTGAEAARALHEAHRSGIVHRDLKPENLFLTRRGLKLLDFGLAKLVGPAHGATANVTTRIDARDADRPITSLGTVLGTVPYMAPEQVEGRAADARSDIFSLGVVLYEMLTGQRPFVGESAAAIFAAILAHEPPAVSSLRAEVPALLDRVVRRCLEKDPEDRWHSALDLASALEWMVAEVPTRGETSASAAPAKSAASVETGRTGALHIEYLRSADGTGIAAARGGSGRPLLVVPALIDSIETAWASYAAAFPGREVILYDRRGTGLSDRGPGPRDPQPYLADLDAVVDGFGVETCDLLGTLMGAIEAASFAARQPERIGKLVLRSPISSLADWARIPAMAAALATLEHDWDYFVESFSQLVVGWGEPSGRRMAQRFRAVTSRDELRALLAALHRFDLQNEYPKIRATTLVEHHPGYFFPDDYSRLIASRIPRCRLSMFTGPKTEFFGDLSIARAFLE